MMTAATSSAGAAIATESVWTGRLFSGGWRPGGGGVLRVIEPATGRPLTEVGAADAADVREAARAAALAQPAWAAAPASARAAVLREAAQQLAAAAEALRPWLMRETGGVPGKADTEIGLAAAILHEAAGLATQPAGVVLPGGPGRVSFARRVPHGVVGVVSPFNFPLVLSARAVAPALALGNAVLLKPDPRTPIAGGVILARLFEAAGLPAGLLHVLPGGADTGEAVVVDPDVAMVSFTGSTAAGRRVGELCGRHLKKVTLELGGKNSTIVLDDADLDVAASNVAWGAWLHQGQICMATGRLLVDRRVLEPLCDRLCARADRLPVGDPSSQPAALGPLIDEGQRDRVHRMVSEAVAGGAVVRAGGSHQGLFYRPTVLTGVRPGMRVFDEEVFGPVVAVVPFADDREAVALANSGAYGLAAGVITRSIERAMFFAAQLRTGIVHINDQSVADEPWVPFGGRGASGNGGRHGGLANAEEFTQWQWVTVQDRATPYPF
jgi:benzaldehyde dehydrogenase (NAD)